MASRGGRGRLEETWGLQAGGGYETAAKRPVKNLRHILPEGFYGIIGDLGSDIRHG